MTDAAKAKWQQLSEDEKETLLKKLFVNVLFNQTNLPEFMTDRDWSDLVQDTRICFEPHQEPDYQFSAIVDLDDLAYKYGMLGCNQFAILHDYLTGHLTKVKLGPLDLFTGYAEQNEDMWFDFNLEAVYLWMSQDLV